MKPKVALEMIWDTRSCMRNCDNCIRDEKCLLKEAYKTLCDFLEDKKVERVKRKIK